MVPPSFLGQGLGGGAATEKLALEVLLERYDEGVHQLDSEVQLLAEGLEESHLLPGDLVGIPVDSLGGRQCQLLLVLGSQLW